jgi:hypothetical protein
VPPGPAPEVVEIQGTQGVLDVFGHRLERHLAKEGTRDPLGLVPEVRTCGEKTLQNGLGLPGVEPIEDRGPPGRSRLPGRSR